MQTTINITACPVEYDKCFTYKNIEYRSDEYFAIIDKHMADFIIIWSRDYTNRITIERTTIELNEGL